MQSLESKLFNKYAPKFYPETFILFLVILALQMLLYPGQLTFEDIDLPAILFVLVPASFLGIAGYLSVKDLTNPAPLHPEASRFMVSVGIIIYGLAGTVSAAYIIDLLLQSATPYSTILTLIGLVVAYVALLQGYFLYSVVLDEKSSIDQNDVYVPQHPTAKVFIVELAVTLVLIFVINEITPSWWGALFSNLAISNFITTIIRKQYMVTSLHSK